MQLPEPASARVDAAIIAAAAKREAVHAFTVSDIVARDAVHRRAARSFGHLTVEALISRAADIAALPRCRMDPGPSSRPSLATLIRGA